MPKITSFWVFSAPFGAPRARPGTLKVVAYAPAAPFIRVDGLGGYQPDRPLGRLPPSDESAAPVLRARQSIGYITFDAIIGLAMIVDGGRLHGRIFIHGGDDKDKLNGGRGNDFLLGGADDDDLKGGSAGGSDAGADGGATA